MPKQKVWRFTPKRRASLKRAQQEHKYLVELGLRARGHRSSARQVRLGRQSRNN